MPVMQETELRFHVPAEHRERLRRLADPRGDAASTPLAAIYFDTPDRRLAQAGIGLRLRREGRRWVQTCKGPAEDGLTRLEHNAVLPAGTPAELDLARHAGHPLAGRLAAVESEALQARFRTEIRRVHRPLRIAGARVELAWDEGRLLAGAGAALQTQPVHELELELLSGSPGALLRHAHGLVARWPLCLDLRSKAERGENLAHGLSRSPARKARPLVLDPAMAPGEALRALLLNCFEQVGANASQIGCGDSEPDHVHQLRVGLRRLRSGLRLFRGLWPELEHPALPAFEQQAAALFRSLGAVRDADVLAGGLTPALQAALREALPGWTAPAPDAQAAHAGGPEQAAQRVRQVAAQQFLIEWLGWLDVLREHPALVSVAEAGERLPLRKGLRRRLRRWHRQVQAQCAQFEHLNTEARHDLRKRFKRLRYGVEFASSLGDTEALRLRMKPLRLAQERLGELNDLELALQMSRERLGRAPEALFELGWLTARREALLAQVAGCMAEVAEGGDLFRKR
jgi:triphosphatase